jgi:hypothetical protein
VLPQFAEDIAPPKVLADDALRRRRPLQEAEMRLKAQQTKMIETSQRL